MSVSGGRAQSAARSPEPGRRLAAVFLWLGVLICVLVAAVAGSLSYHAQYDFEYAHNGGNTLAASMFAALTDSTIASTSLIALYRALSARPAGKISIVNLAFIGLSTMLNAFAAPPGVKALATAIVPPTAFAITYHLVLDQVRDHILTQRGARSDGRGAGELALSLLLWLLRLLISPRSTLAALRHHIIETAPTVPFGPRALRPQPRTEPSEHQPPPATTAPATPAPRRQRRRPQQPTPASPP